MGIGVVLELVSPRGLTETMAAYLAVMGSAYFASNVGATVAASKLAAVTPQEAAVSPEYQTTVDAIANALAEFKEEFQKRIDEGKQQSTIYMQALQEIQKAQIYIIKAAGLEKE